MLARCDVRPSANELRDALVAALGAVEPLNEYETHRFDARRIGGHLAWVVGALKRKAEYGDDIDLAALAAYEDELREQTGVAA